VHKIKKYVPLNEDTFFETYKLKNMTKKGAEKKFIDSSAEGFKYSGYTDNYVGNTTLIINIKYLSEKGKEYMYKVSSESRGSTDDINERIMREGLANSGKKAYYRGLADISGHPVIAYYNQKEDEYIYLNADYVNMVTAIVKGKSNSNTIPKYVDYSIPTKPISLFPDTVLMPLMDRSGSLQKQVEYGDEISDLDKNVIRHFIVGKNLDGDKLWSHDGILEQLNAPNSREVQVAKKASDGTIYVAGWSTKSKFGEMLKAYLKKFGKQYKTIGDLKKVV
jgi:hypothetical protein